MYMTPFIFTFTDCMQSVSSIPKDVHFPKLNIFTWGNNFGLYIQQQRLAGIKRQLITFLNSIEL